ncbi:MAG: CHASE domain-containing protein [Pseudomonadota bacterium]
MVTHSAGKADEGGAHGSRVAEPLPNADHGAPPPRPRDPRRWLVNYPRAIPLTIFIAIIAVTALSVFAIESNARAREAALMRGYAKDIGSALERQGASFSSYLRAGAALFSTTQTVSDTTFRQFVSELRLDLENRGAEGIGWAALRSVDDAPAEPGMPRSLKGSEVQVENFYPDTARNRRALGTDMNADLVRAAAMQEARRTVQPTASGRIVLAQEGAGDAPGFIIFMPVFRSIDGAEGNERALAGFVYSPFNASEFLDTAVQGEAPSSLGVRLYDGGAATENLLVAHSLSQGGGTSIEQDVNIANRSLHLVVQAPKGGTLAPLSMVTLLFGLAVASLLMLLARLLTAQAFDDQRRLAFFEEQHSIRNSLTRELNHRVKNTLANVLSIISLTRRRTSTKEEFAQSLEGRIRALSATHDLLTGTDWGTTPIRSVIEAELQHFHSARDHNLTLDGPSVELAPNDALSFGLAIHELATNAAKYGAFSTPEGRVSVSWVLLEDDMAEVEWQERDGPEVPVERTRGFGTELIEKIVAHELKQPVNLEFARAGVRCVMRVPVRQQGDFQMRDKS